jgi:transcriptional regulator with XRE-family HTH domain
MKKTAEILALNMRTLRLERGFSHVELGRMAGISKTYTALVEKMLYNPTMEGLDGIAKALGVPLWMLLHPRMSKIREKAGREAAKVPVFKT